MHVANRIFSGACSKDCICLDTQNRKESKYEEDETDEEDEEDEICEYDCSILNMLVSKLTPGHQRTQ